MLHSQIVSVSAFISGVWCSFLENYHIWKLFFCSNHFCNFVFHLQYLSFLKLGNLNLQFWLNWRLAYFAKLPNTLVSWIWLDVHVSDIWRHDYSILCLNKRLCQGFEEYMSLYLCLSYLGNNPWINNDGLNRWFLVFGGRLPFLLKSRPVV